MFEDFTYYNYNFVY